MTENNTTTIEDLIQRTKNIRQQLVLRVEEDKMLNRELGRLEGKIEVMQQIQDEG